MRLDFTSNILRNALGKTADIWSGIDAELAKGQQGIADMKAGRSRKSNTTPPSEWTPAQKVRRKEGDAIRRKVVRDNPGKLALVGNYVKGRENERYAPGEHYLGVNTAIEWLPTHGEAVAANERAWRDYARENPHSPSVRHRAAVVAAEARKKRNLAMAQKHNDVYGNYRNYVRENMSDYRFTPQNTTDKAGVASFRDTADNLRQLRFDAAGNVIEAGVSGKRVPVTPELLKELGGYGRQYVQTAEVEKKKAAEEAEATEKTDADALAELEKKSPGALAEWDDTSAQLETLAKSEDLDIARLAKAQRAGLEAGLLRLTTQTNAEDARNYLTNTYLAPDKMALQERKLFQENLERRLNEATSQLKAMRERMLAPKPAPADAG